MTAGALAHLLPDAYAHAPGSSLYGGRIEIQSVVGEGPLGTVYRAFEREMGTDVAVKVLRRSLFPAREDRATFVERCTEARRLDRPGLVRLLYADARGPYPFYVMRLVAGNTLRGVLDRRRLAGRPFNPAQTAVIVARIAQALEQLHGVVPAHGLLKPDNILLLPNELSVSDFHLTSCMPFAVLLDEETRKGGALYLAPEAHSGASLSPASDVYSLAMIAGELLTGVLPTHPLFWASLRAPDVPENLERVVTRCFAPDPRRRLPTPKDLSWWFEAWGEEYAMSQPGGKTRTE